MSEIASRGRDRIALLSKCMVVISILTAVTGCSAADDPKHASDPEVSQESTIDAQNPRELADLLEGMVSYDYEPFESPVELAEAVEVAIDGSVTNVAAGVSDEHEEGRGVTLVEIAVTNDLKDQGTSAVTLVLGRANLDVSIFREALPIGTRVVVFGSPYSHALRSGEAAAEAPLIQNWPQGLYFVAPDGTTVPVWHQDASGEWATTAQDVDALVEAVDPTD